MLAHQVSKLQVENDIISCRSKLMKKVRRLKMIMRQHVGKTLQGASVLAHQVSKLQHQAENTHRDFSSSKYTTGCEPGP
jgi:hypothetical protein